MFKQFVLVCRNIKNDFDNSMEENFIIITDANQLNKLFETIQDKIVVIMLYTKSNSECQKARNFFKNVASNNLLSYFCFIDVDKFKGESRYIDLNLSMPCFICYYSGNVICTYQTSNEKEIAQMVHSAQQYMMSQNNTRNNLAGNQFQQNINPMQIRQQILNHVQMQNPSQYYYLINNPAALNQLVQNQIQLMSQQQVIGQPQMMQPNSQTIQQSMPMQQPIQMQQSMQQSLPMQQAMPIQQTIPMQQTMPMQQAIPLQQTMPMQQTLPMQPSLMAQLQQSNMAIPSTIAQQNTIANNLMPTLEQMQQMFHIFKSLVEMGVIKLSNEPVTEQVDYTTDMNKINFHNTLKIQQNKTEPDNVIVLPNGDKLYPQKDGTFGLVKNKQSL